MDEKALQIVRDYIAAHLDKSDPTPELEVYTSMEGQGTAELEVSDFKHSS